MASTTFAGPVTSQAGFVGDIVGNITGNVTGNTTGAHNGTVGATTPAAVSATTLGASGQATLAALTASGAVILSNASVSMTNLPTADPTAAGRLWIDTDNARVLKVSAGA